jgi:dienelactone hydrolase
MVDYRHSRVGSTQGWMELLIALSLGVAACGGENAVGKATATAAPLTSAIRSTQTEAPQGIDVPGAQWLKVEGAGGRSNNVQIAAVLRPQASGAFPLVVYLHGGEGLLLGDVSAASHLALAGFTVIVGCWSFSPATPFVHDGISSPRVACLENVASADDATRALIEVGQQLPGVKKGAIGLIGVSIGGPQALSYSAKAADVKAVVADSSPTGPLKVSVPVLILGATADPLVSVQSQQTYEQNLRDSGSTVESHYYDGGKHVVLVSEFQEDAIKRITDFFGRYLK